MILDNEEEEEVKNEQLVVNIDKISSSTDVQEINQKTLFNNIDIIVHNEKEVNNEVVVATVDHTSVNIVSQIQENNELKSKLWDILAPDITNIIHNNSVSVDTTKHLKTFIKNNINILKNINIIDLTKITTIDLSNDDDDDSSKEEEFV
jgi:carboxypeptidase C (cathepsin A)